MERISLGKSISSAFRHVRMLRNKCLKDCGCSVTGAHFHTFWYFLNHPDSSEKQAAEALGKDKTAIAKSVKKLAEQGLIVCRTDEEDARIIRISPTHNGKQEQKKVEKALHQITDIMSAGIAKECIDIFLETLEAMQKNAIDHIERGHQWEKQEI